MSIEDVHKESGSEESRIVCRTCNNPISLYGETCPHCGTSIRSPRAFIALIGFGGLLLLGSLFDLTTLWLFAVLGAGMMFAGGYFIKDRRDRIEEANATGTSNGG